MQVPQCPLLNAVYENYVCNSRGKEGQMSLFTRLGIKLPHETLKLVELVADCPFDDPGLPETIPPTVNRFIVVVQPARYSASRW